jgi:CRISPR-associated endonuclease Csn1
MAEKIILGLDLGTTSIGWAIVKEGENSEIIKAGVRVVPLSTDEITNFSKLQAETANAVRTRQRGARRSLQRFKLRREALIAILKKHQIISENTLFSETGKNSTNQTLKKRALAASEEIELEDFARVLLMINKKRGFKSNRKAKTQEEGEAIDGMEIAKLLFDQKLTPGQLVSQRLKQNKKSIPDFYRSDLDNEFDLIWNFQKEFHIDVLTNQFYEELKGKKKVASVAIFKKLGFDGEEFKEMNMQEKKQQRFHLRALALKEKLTLNELAEIFPDINNNLNASSGYLGAISDRSKELYFRNQTVGQYQYDILKNNIHESQRNQIFSRHDYINEFEKIWAIQSSFHSVLNTPNLKEEIRNAIIFYQRGLKSQKGLLSTCEFETVTKEREVDGKIKKIKIGPKVCPKSSPLFQEFKIWAQLNNIEILEGTKRKGYKLELEQKEMLYTELNWHSELTDVQTSKLLGLAPNEKINFKKLEGNRTNTALVNVLEKYFEKEGGYEELNLSKYPTQKLLKNIEDLAKAHGLRTDFLWFNSALEGKSYDNQEILKLWHLLYSYESDKSESGIDSLKDILVRKFSFSKDSVVCITNIELQDDYSSLCSKAIRKILPHLREGNRYDEACELAGYNHSHFETREDLKNKVLKDALEILPKSALRNPVVEKILNQMINVINLIIEKYGKPDEIRIELARDLKQSAKERNDASKAMSSATTEHEKIRKILFDQFGFSNPSRNDIIRYKLYLELESNGYHTLYSNKYISKEDLFSEKIDIEHIIPKSKCFDDSFSNKTLEFREINIKKDNFTGIDFMKNEYSSNAVEEYCKKIEKLFKGGKLSYSKRRKLLMEENDIPDDFIARDLGNTRYIAKKAREILLEIVRVVTPTTGKITDRLRQDWQLVDVLKELTIEKYRSLGLVENVENRHGHKTEKITDWSKRNDHRHHAMDAITVAFTKPSFIQYLNNMNAKSDKSGSIYGIEQKEMHRTDKGKLLFNCPMQIDVFRKEAKEHLENILVSFKAKNKVTTKNRVKQKGKEDIIYETPRGQMHLETVYGASKQYATKTEKVNASFDLTKIETVANQSYKRLLKLRLEQFENDPTKAFTGKNALAKNPIFLTEDKKFQIPDTIKTVSLETRYTIRKDITPELKIEKVIDVGVKRILEARLKEHSGNAKSAFSNLNEFPIFLDKKNGVVLKRVTISGVANAISLHHKKDQNGETILDTNGNQIPVSYVNTGNNHHVAIYKDENGKLHEEVVSFMEAVQRQNNGQNAINKTHEKGWEFMFTMKQNEYFVFPNEKTGFDPSEIDLTDRKNVKKISPNLYRVQKFTSCDYWFRHHLETTVENIVNLKGIAFKPTQGFNGIRHIVKVRLNHLGEIIQTGE